MEITLTLSDDLAKQLQSIQNPNEFIAEMLANALQNYFLQSTVKSKWARIAQRVQNDPNHLAGYSKALKQDIREFRNHFILSNQK